MSTNSGKPALEQKADPLEILDAWGSGDLAAHTAPRSNENSLTHAQMKSLWALLNTPSAPGTIDLVLPR
jgi:hypothetical protein